MVLEDHPVIKNHLDENSDIEISHSNEDKMKIHLDKIKQTLPLIKEKHLQISNKKLKDENITIEEKEKEELKKEEIKKLDDTLIHDIILEKASRDINYWYRFKYLIIFGSFFFL